jgi:glycosyltransferase-like protein
MRIALLTHSVNPRGGVVHTLELARALHDSGHDVTVFAPAAPGQALFRAVPHRVSLVPLMPVAAAENLHDMVAARIAAYERHLRALPELERFDVWHAHDGIGGNALANLVDDGLIDGFVRTVHHLDRFDDARVMRWQRRSFECARLVLCVSPLWCRTLRTEHGIDAQLVSNGVDLQRYQPQPLPTDADVAARYGLRPGAPLWLSVGGVEERKNTLGALLAFALHRRVHPQAQWVVAGGASLLDHGAYQARFNAALAECGMADAVVFTGPVPDHQMPALFRLANGVLMPSLIEGFGLVVLEALASGTPVVVSRQPPFTEYLHESEAHWADPRVPASIAAAMALALAHPVAAVPEVCLRHSWPASAARHVSLYRALRALHAPRVTSRLRA